jgi:hypothetical protein
LEVDQKLKQELLGKLPDNYPSLPVYSIRKLSDPETEERARYYASQFMGGKSIQSFRSHKEDGSTLVSLPWNTTMEIFHNSDTVIIEKKMNPFEHTIKKNLELESLTEIAIKVMKKLELDKYKLSIEHAELEKLWEIKASGITIEEKKLPVILCRIVGAFRRYINGIPVYGGASIYIKIAEDELIESIGVEWRQINEKPNAEAKIIRPEVAVEQILKELGSTFPDHIITTQDYEPELFALGYYSKPKRQHQNYMQPVYIAMLKSLGLSKWNQKIVIPATNPVFEHFSTDPKRPGFTKRGSR